MSEQAILDALKEINAPAKTAEVAEKAGIDSKEAGKIITKLKKAGKVISPKRCFYSLPE